MAIIPVPAKFSFTNVSRFALQRGGNVLRSRYTGQSQRVVYPFAVWQFQGTLVDYDGEQAGIIRSFLVQLEGQKNTFRLPVPGYTHSSTVNGQILTTTMATYGAGAAPVRATSLTAVIGGGYTIGGIFNEGDYFTIGDELKVVTQAVATAGTDVFTVNFKPPLRKAYPNATPILYHNPTILMHSSEDDVANWDLSPPYRHGIKISAIEAVEI